MTVSFLHPSGLHWQNMCFRRELAATKASKNHGGRTRGAPDPPGARRAAEAARPRVSGRIHSVRDSFTVVAVASEASSNASAAPTTEDTSWMATPAQVPNASGRANSVLVIS